MVVEHTAEEVVLRTVEVALHTVGEVELHTVEEVVLHTVEGEEHHTVAVEVLHIEVVERHTVEEEHHSLAEERGQENHQIQANLAPVQGQAREEVHGTLVVEAVRGCTGPADGFGRMGRRFLGWRMGRSLEQVRLCLDYHDHVAETARHVGYPREQA
jgi:hypothetical protein